MREGRKIKIRNFFLSFGKAQISAFLGGLFDFTIYATGIRALGFSPYFSNMISGSLGSVVNFTINRYWTFQSTGTPAATQIVKFIVVVAGSVLLKSMGVFLLADYILWNPYYSKVLVEVVVSLGFNFFIQKHWVFRQP